MKKITIFSTIITLLVITLSFFFFSDVNAATLDNPLKAASIQDIIFLVVDLAVYVGYTFAILAIIFVGFKFVAAQGKPEEISKAKMWLLYIVIGLAILISSKVIATIVKNTLVASGVVDSKVFTP